MKVIELLNKIANGEELPNKFKFNDDIYYKLSSKCYRCSETDDIFEECFILEDLDKEIEIIEEDKKIEKIDIKKEHYGEYIEDYCFKNVPLENLILNQNEVIIINKINEIIDKIKMMEKK